MQRDVVSEPALLYTVNEAAALLRVSRSRIYDLMNRGLLTSVSIGASRRIPRAALETYIAQLVREGRQA